MEGAACVHGSILLKWMGGMEWIYLAEYRDKCYATVRMVMHVTSSIQYRPITCYEGPEGEMKYSSTLSLTLTLDWGSLKPRPNCFTPNNDPVTAEQKAVRALGPGWNGGENSSPPRFAPRTVQPVASRYTV
jgi:hypothetical protein